MLSHWEKCHPPHGGCGLKFFCLLSFTNTYLSPSTRRVWIEIEVAQEIFDRINKVTLHTEGVDWNLQGGDTRGGSHTVTLHTEGVDWNSLQHKHLFVLFESPSTRRVWIEMYATTAGSQAYQRSPSTRRVWIEMQSNMAYLVTPSPSPSTRRVWIEIQKL